LPRVDGESDGDRFFVLTHDKVGEIQLKVNKGKRTKRGEDCDNIPLTFLEQDKETKATSKDPWSLIGDKLGRNQPVTVRKVRS
jgi:hypothetical protein